MVMTMKKNHFNFDIFLDEILEKRNEIENENFDILKSKWSNVLMKQTNKQEKMCLFVPFDKVLINQIKIKNRKLIQMDCFVVFFAFMNVNVESEISKIKNQKKAKSFHLISLIKH